MTSRATAESSMTSTWVPRTPPGAAPPTLDGAGSFSRSTGPPPAHA